MKDKIAASNPDTISIGHSPKACDGYLALYKEVFTDPGYAPYDFNDLDESEAILIRPR
jgi:hypothetical protein